MFDFVRKHTRIMMLVLFLLIIPSFVLLGVDGYNKSSGNGVAVARVGGDEIFQGEWDAAHKFDSDRLRASMPDIDVKLLDSPEARYATLERLVRERVLLKAADKFKLTTSDARLARDLQDNPTIASLRQPDGKLDMERYRQLAASQGLTPEGFEARVRQDLSVRQIAAGVTNTGLATQSIADVSLNAFFEKREAQVAIFSSADFVAKVDLSDSDLEAYYKENVGSFQAPESATIEYVVLDLESVSKSISLNDSDLKAYYEQNAARLSGAEERRASHILINAPKGASEADRQKAKAQAEALLLSLKKAPETFAVVAKANSQDAGSAVNGGDLDFFTRGSMVKPFEDAAFSLNKGDISEVIESEFGYHIIKLTDVKTPKQRSFDELKPGLETELKAQQAKAKFAEAAEIFTNSVYEQSDSLKPVADKLKLDIKTASNVVRQRAPNATGVLLNEKFISAIFSADSLSNKRNTEAIETAPNQLTAGRVVLYTPARTLALADVRQAVKDRLVALRAAELAKKEGETKLSAWRVDPAMPGMPAATVLSREQPQAVTPQVLSAVLQADGNALPAFVGVELGARGYAVARVNKVLPRTAPTEEVRKQELVQYSQWWTSAENQAYFNVLKDQFKAEIMVPRPAITSAIDSGQATER